MGTRRMLSPAWTAAGLVLLLAGAASLWIFKPWRSAAPQTALTLEAGRELTLAFAPLGAGEFQTRVVRVQEKMAWGDQIKNILESMASQPAPGEPSLWPFALKVRAVYLLKNGALILDLEDGLAYNQNVSAATEWRVVRSLVRTLRKNFPEVGAVKLLINGAEAETLAGHVDITRPLDADD